MTKLENDPRLQEAMYRILQGELKKEDEYMEQIRKDTVTVPVTLLVRLKRFAEEYFSRKQKRQRRTSILLIAAVLAALVLGACALLEPVREIIFGAIVTKYEEYFDFNWNREETDRADLMEYPDIPSTFDYVPKGYELISMQQAPGIVQMCFERSHNDNITYTVCPVGSETMYDMDYTITQEEINGITVLVMSGNGNEPTQLLWRDEFYAYDLDGFVSKKELIKMLEGLH